ncbi:hypothetical protein HDU91_001349 [Kappamyces sp. JEL0680]|nr:hypothetical protein HDU91_001349 [Kappamyces sp. JEL0680]
MSSVEAKSPAAPLGGLHPLHDTALGGAPAFGGMRGSMTNLLGLANDDRPITAFQITRKKVKNGRMFTVEGTAFDLDRLIAGHIKNRPAKTPHGIVRFTKTKIFEEFLQAAILYSRAFLREKLVLAQEMLSKPNGSDVPPSIVNFIAELNKTEQQSIEKLEAFAAHEALMTELAIFSKCYCEVLLSADHSKSPSKERALFEAVYAIAIEVSCQALQSYNLAPVVAFELQRMFRSDFFKTQPLELLKDPISYIAFKFITNLKSPFDEPDVDIETKPAPEESVSSSQTFNFHLSNLKTRTEAVSEAVRVQASSARPSSTKPSADSRP